MSNYSPSQGAKKCRRKSICCMKSCDGLSCVCYIVNVIMIFMVTEVATMNSWSSTCELIVFQKLSLSLLVWDFLKLQFEPVMHFVLFRYIRVGIQIKILYSPQEWWPGVWNTFWNKTATYFWMWSYVDCIMSEIIYSRIALCSTYKRYKQGCYVSSHSIFLSKRKSKQMEDAHV